MTTVTAQTKNLVSLYGKLYFFKKETAKTVFAITPYDEEEKRFSKERNPEIVELVPLTEENATIGARILLIGFPLSTQKLFKDEHGYSVGEYEGESMIFTFRGWLIVKEDIKVKEQEESKEEEQQTPIVAIEQDRQKRNLNDLEQLKKILASAIKAQKDYIKKRNAARDYDRVNTSHKKIGALHANCDYANWELEKALARVSYFVRTADWYSLSEVREDIRVLSNRCESYNIPEEFPNRKQKT